MSELVRFGVAMDRALLADFDREIAARGYENRSEALRDLIRADLTKTAWDAGAPVAATITVVYNHQVRGVVLDLTEAEAERASSVIATMHVRLDRARALDVLVVEGRAGELAALQGKLAGTKGVLSCELTPAAALSERRGPHLERGEP
jgi:CopG family nickel-responsive transcriptional regulator